MDANSHIGKTVDEWISYKRYNENCAESTLTKYRAIIEKLSEFLLAKDVDVFSAQEAHLIQFSGIHLHEHGITPSARRVYIAALKGFYGYISEQKLIAVSPARRLTYPRSPKKLPVQMQLASAERLMMAPDINSFAGLRDAAIISMVISTGMRVGGLVGLNESSLIWYKHNDLERLAVHLVEKGEKERLVPVDVSAMLLLRAYLGHPDLEDIDRDLDEGDKVLFVSLRNRTVPAHEYRGENRRLSTKSIWTMIQQYAEQAEIPEAEAHPHAMRHLLGTEMAENDADSLMISSTLGHADVNTSKIYVKLALRKMTDVLDAANPLAKIKTPVSPLVQELRKAGQL